MKQQKQNKSWHIWCDALGQKADPDSNHSDKVAVIRTIIFIHVLITNLVIIAGVVRHW